VSVWFFWDGEEFLVYSQPRRQKLRNIERDPKVGLTSTPISRAAM